MYFVLLYVFLCSMYCLFCDIPCIVCMYMCIERLPPGGYPIAVNKYIISYHITFHHRHQNKERIVNSYVEVQ